MDGRKEGKVRNVVMCNNEMGSKGEENMVELKN